MDKNFYAVVTDEVQKALSSKGYTLKNDGDLEYFSDDKRAFTIEYDEEKKLLLLKSAVLNEGEGVDFKTVSSWYLDENAAESDLKSIGNDFSDTVLEQLGEKATAQGIKKVDMPSRDKKAETVTIDSFTARFLSIFPTYKPDYVNNVSVNGEFMFDRFFSEFGVKALKETVESGNAKKIDKMFEMFATCYNIGDSAVSVAIVYSIMANALLDDEKLRKDVYTYMQKHTYLYTATVQMIKLLSKPSNRKKYMEMGK